MLLDTLDDMEAARGLYASLGFQDIPPYYFNPIPGAHYLKADLGALAMNPFRHLLMTSAHQPPLGTWIMSASPIVAEAIGHAGFDWGVIDMEHSPLDMMEVVHLLQALSATQDGAGGARAVERRGHRQARARRRRHDAAVPVRADREEARRAVAATRYPPRGGRGMAGMSRASRFGTVANYFQTANDNIGVIVQLETRAGVDALEAIAAVDGVDACSSARPTCPPAWATSASPRIPR